MSGDLTSIVQTVGSIASLVLIPIWHNLSQLNKKIEDTNLKMAEQYVKKEECQQKCSETNAEIKQLKSDTNHDLRRVYDRLDEHRWGTV